MFVVVCVMLLFRMRARKDYNLGAGAWRMRYMLADWRPIVRARRPSGWTVPGAWPLLFERARQDVLSSVLLR